MQVKFELSKDTEVHLQPDGNNYLVHNATGSVLLTVEELEELGRVKADQSKNDLEE